MNERIEKLLDEAELDIVWNQDNPDYKWVEGSEESLLKFAELIVRECVMLCDKVYEQNDNVKIQAGATFFREDIKQHFGVEE